MYMIEWLLNNLKDHTQCPRISICDGRLSFWCLPWYNSPIDRSRNSALFCEATIEEVALGWFTSIKASCEISEATHQHDGLQNERLKHDQSKEIGNLKRRVSPESMKDGSKAS
jgi:hypothetical protein